MSAKMSEKKTWIEVPCDEQQLGVLFEVERTFSSSLFGMTVVCTTLLAVFPFVVLITSHLSASSSRAFVFQHICFTMFASMINL
jgi:hypothetical protein